jgi:hypothetical protein
MYNSLHHLTREKQGGGNMTYTVELETSCTRARRGSQIRNGSEILQSIATRVQPKMETKELFGIGDSGVMEAVSLPMDVYLALERRIERNEYGREVDGPDFYVSPYNNVYTSRTAYNFFTED